MCVSADIRQIYRRRAGRSVQETDRQTDRQTETRTQTDRQTETERDRQTETDRASLARHAHKQMHSRLWCRQIKIAIATSKAQPYRSGGKI